MFRCCCSPWRRPDTTRQVLDALVCGGAVRFTWLLMVRGMNPKPRLQVTIWFVSLLIGRANSKDAFSRRIKVVSCGSAQPLLGFEQEEAGTF